MLPTNSRSGDTNATVFDARALPAIQYVCETQVLSLTPAPEQRGGLHKKVAGQKTKAGGGGGGHKPQRAHRNNAVRIDFFLSGDVIINLTGGHASRRTAQRWRPVKNASTCAAAAAAAASFVSTRVPWPAAEPGTQPSKCTSSCLRNRKK